MGETNFTPGPWHALPFTSNPMLAGVMAADGKSIAEVIGHHASPANATLIAAAPDLYAALGVALVAMQANLEYATRKDEHALALGIEHARAALARARGETP
jgi:hypothetical protein